MWMQTVLDGNNEDQKEQTTKDLIEYCRLDMLAMVEIYSELRKL